MRGAYLVAVAVVASGGLVASQLGSGSPGGSAGMSGLTADQDPTLPASGATAALRLAGSPRHAEWVTVKVGGDSVMAWVVYPERQDKAPVVLVIHENTGLTTWARAVADQLAAEGFIGIAPDLLTMRRSDGLSREWSADSGRAAIRPLTDDEVQRSLDAVARYGTTLPAANGVYGVVGFCWGGARSFLHAAHAPSLKASVVYYGSPPSTEQIGSIQAPVLGLYGGSDARITATVPATDTAMQAAGKAYQHHVYDGAGHGFLRAQEGQDGANLKASQAAWPATVEFLRARLGR